MADPDTVDPRERVARESGRSEGEHDAGNAMAARTDDGRVVVVAPNAMAVEGPPSGDERTDDPHAHQSEPDQAEGRSVTDLVEEPAKVMRIGTMIRQLLAEVKEAPLDDASRNRLRDIYDASVTELSGGLAPELVDELERLARPFTADTTPSDSELRIAQAQLVGWLEGLFQGIQTALVAQQMAARSQLEQMRRALPPGAMPPNPSGEGDQRGPGMYL